MNPTELQVRRQLEAMRTQHFELLLLEFHEDGRRGANLPLTFDQIMRRVPWLRAQNVKGQNINIRPMGNHLSLLDDLTREQVERLEGTGYEPCVVVETSPENYQAWLDHGRELNEEEATVFSRILAETAECDVRAAGRRHAGRLAGFTNRKEKHRQPNGLYPFVRLHLAKQRVFTKASGLELPAAPAAPILPIPSSREEKTIEEFHNDPRYGGDYSRSDFAYALYAHSHGIDEATIIASILQRDLRKKGNEVSQRRYAKYTSDRARKKARR
jgi:hypothetical protein